MEVVHLRPSGVDLPQFRKKHFPRLLLPASKNPSCRKLRNLAKEPLLWTSNEEQMPFWAAGWIVCELREA